MRIRRRRSGWDREAFYGKVPDEIAVEVIARLPGEFHDLMAELNERFDLALGQRGRDVGRGVPVG